MPNKTLSVRENDLPLWERAERAAKDARTTVSALVATALAEYLGGTDVITVTMYGWNPSTPVRKESFVGRWIVDPDLESDYSNDEARRRAMDRGLTFNHSGGPGEWRAGLAETGRGRIAVYLHHWNYDGEFPPELHDFDTLDDARRALKDDPRIPADFWPYGIHGNLRPTVWRNI